MKLQAPPLKVEIDPIFPDGGVLNKNVSVESSPDDFIQKLKTSQTLKVEKAESSGKLGLVQVFSNTVEHDFFEIYSKSKSSQKKESSIRTENSSGVEECTNNFDFLHSIGRGAYGEIFLVKRKTTNEKYALKVLEKEHILKNDKHQAVFRERDIGMDLADHPNIVDFHGAF